MMRRRKVRSVMIRVSRNFYDELERQRGKTNLTFPKFTELIHKDIIFPQRRKLRFFL